MNTGWALALILALALLANDLQVHFEAVPEGDVFNVEISTITSLDFIEIRSEWVPISGNISLNSISASLKWPPASSNASDQALVPIRFQLNSKGKLLVQQGERIFKGTVLAEKDSGQLRLLRRSLPFLDPMFRKEAEAKIEDLEIVSVLDGIVEDIKLSVEEETIHITLLIRAKNHS